jgi:hypothetical protein
MPLYSYQGEKVQKEEQCLLSEYLYIMFVPVCLQLKLKLNILGGGLGSR